MSHVPISGVHNPSPYLRRFRLPVINSSATVAAYDELLSPVDNCAKLAFISALNFQSKQLGISKPMVSSIKVPLNGNAKLESSETDSQRTETVSFTESSSYRENSLNYRMPNRAPTDMEFRFVATELEKKCNEYDLITDLAVGNGNSIGTKNSRR